MSGSTHDDLLHMERALVGKGLEDLGCREIIANEIQSPNERSDVSESSVESLPTGNMWSVTFETASTPARRRDAHERRKLVRPVEWALSLDELE